MATDLTELSLADFYFPDSDDPLAPSADYTDWRREVAWATSVYEQAMLQGPTPRTSISVHGERKPVINLASYNYLGLAKHPETISAAKRALDTYGTGACGSPILSGMSDLHRRLERRLSEFNGREQTMLFNSGFGGALGMMAGLLRRGDVAILDSRSHISLMDGSKLSGAKVELFEHNNPDSLDDLLSKHEGRRRAVVTEGIFSMDGDFADLPALLPVAEKHGVGIVVDEAHSILTCGPTGGGVTEHFGVDDRIALKYATFSKSFAAVGGFISGSAAMLDYLRFFSNSYGFSCALPPAMAAAIMAGLEVATRGPSLRDRLAKNAEYFRRQIQSLGLSTGTSVSHVVPILIGSNRALLYELAIELRDRGVFIATVDYPSVAEDSLRFRASITCDHTRADLDEALNIIADTVVPRIAAGK